MISRKQKQKRETENEQKKIHKADESVVLARVRVHGI